MNQIGLINKNLNSNQPDSNSINSQNNTKIEQHRPANLTVSKIFSNNQKWRECKIIGKNISIRSYSASCAFQDKFYVYGGYQILNGSLADFFCINLNDDQLKFNWIEIQQKNGVSPGPRSKHALVAGKQKIYLIGGIYQDVNSSKDIYEWDGKTQNWSQLKPEGIENLPKIDSFGCVLIEKEGVQKIYIVGGYNGEKAKMQNAVYEFIPSKNKLSVLFKNYPTKSKDIMHIRCGHSLTTDNNDLYIFGGKNQDQRFNDLWRFNLTSLSYERLPDKGDIPAIRNGHSMNYYNNRLYVFGGIHDITWEMDDLHIYNLVKKEWTTLEQDSPRRVEKKQSPDKQQKSIEKKQNKKKNWYESIGDSLNPPNKSLYSSPMNQTTQKNYMTAYHSKERILDEENHQGNMLDEQRKKAFYQKKQEMLKTFEVDEKQKDKYILYETTSQAMRISLDVIGNPTGKTNQNSDKLTEFGKQTHSKFLAPLQNNMNLVIGKRPCARDGHCSVMLNDELIIFGGDRHQMSFNDIYKLNFNLAQKQFQN